MTLKVKSGSLSFQKTILFMTSACYDQCLYQTLIVNHNLSVYQITWETLRNANENEFRTSKMVAGGHFEKKWKLRFDLKWREMQTKMNFGHSKWTPGGHFQKKKWKLCFDPKWREMQLKMNFGHPKWPPAAIFRKKINCVLIRNGEKYKQKWILDIQNGHRQPFSFEFLSEILRSPKQKWLAATILKKVSFWFEMVRNVRKNRWASGPLVLLFRFLTIFSKTVQ